MTIQSERSTRSQSLTLLPMLATTLLTGLACAAQPEAIKQAAQDAVTETVAPAVEPLFPPRFGVFEAPERSQGSVRIATYNIENLFDDADDPALSDRQEDIDDLKPEGQMSAVARAIREIDADILCLQEIESREALDWFMSGRLDEMGYTHVLSLDAGDERGIEQAIVSRFPIVEHTNWVRRPLGGIHPEKYGSGRNWHAGEDIVFHRSPLMGVVEVPGSVLGTEEPLHLRLIVVHHKSGRHSQYWRDKEAEGLLEVLAGIDEKSGLGPTLILGDFNAQHRDPSVQAYLTGGFTDLFADNKGDAARWASHETGRRIDLILANEEARSLADPKSEFVLGTPARPSDISWRQLDTFDGYAADHYPVVVELRALLETTPNAGESP